MMSGKNATMLLCCGVWLLAWVQAGLAGTFYVDPENGKMDGDGSADKPWSTLEAVVADKLGAVKPGDTILLRTGYHGDVNISQARNDAVITVAAEEGHKPVLSRLAVSRASKWTFRGLTITPSAAKEYQKCTIVSLGLRKKEPSSDLVIEDCFIYSVLDTSKWSAEDWGARACNGISLGRDGKNLVARNNYLLNVRFGISMAAPGSLVEGNTIENFSGDGIRVTVDDLTVQYNTIKNCYNVDANHDDGIQCFLFNKGRGTVRRATIRGNIIINREDPKQPHRGPLQGIGFFDGPLVDFLVDKNVVLVAHWHGVSLYDAQGCKILDNAVYTKWHDEKPRPWIMLGSKQDRVGSNVVRGNLAHRFNLGKGEVDAAANEEVTEKAFYRKLGELEGVINKKFGALHPVCRRPRIKKSP